MAADFNESLSCHETMDHQDSHIPQNEPQLQSDLAAGPPVLSKADPALYQDDRIIRNLLSLESKYLPSAPDYFRYVQSEINPSMRKIVADWMLQVCEECRCPPEVFAMALNYFDRFLALCRVSKTKLQLIGCVCLLLSSKFKETNPISGERIIYYSDFSVTEDEMRETEMLVLQELRWELSGITPLDFMDHIIFRLVPKLEKINLCQNVLKQRTESILVLCLTEYKFCYLNPSLLTCSALFAVISSWVLSCHSLTLESCIQNLEQEVCAVTKELKSILEKLRSLTYTKPDDIKLCTSGIISTSPKYLLRFPQQTDISSEIAKENSESTQNTSEMNTTSVKESENEVSSTNSEMSSCDVNKMSSGVSELSPKTNEMSLDELSENIVSGHFTILSQNTESKNCKEEPENFSILVK